ncbi:MAG: helix-turn-helix domain-containing protein [Alphaproteobacteria bacterium]
MLTIEQCRGARGILGWTQQDLANACGLSKTAINNYEKSHSDIKAESLKAIRMAFESAEIEFIGDNGVTKRRENIKILRGAEALNDLIDDIHQTLATQKTDILISHVTAELPNHLSTQKLFKHIDFLKTHEIKQRILTPDNTQQILGPEDECRRTTKTTAEHNQTSYIYGGKVAIELWGKSMIIVINSAEASEAEAERFEYLWAHAKPTTQNKDQDATTHIFAK